MFGGTGSFLLLYWGLCSRRGSSLKYSPPSQSCAFLERGRKHIAFFGLLIAAALEDKPPSPCSLRNLLLITTEKKQVSQNLTLGKSCCVRWGSMVLGPGSPCPLPLLRVTQVVNVDRMPPYPRPWAKHFIRIGLLIFHICHLRQIFLSQFRRWGDLSIETLNPLLPSSRSMDLNPGIWLQSSEPQWCISSHLLTWHHLPWSLESGVLLLGLSPVSALVRFRLLHSILVIYNWPSLDYPHADLKCDGSSFILLFCFHGSNVTETHPLSKPYFLVFPMLNTKPISSLPLGWPWASADKSPVRRKLTF